MADNIMRARVRGLRGPAIKGDPGGTPDDVGQFLQLSTMTIPPGIDRVLTNGWATLGDGGDGFYIADDIADAAMATAHPRFCTQTSNGRYFRLQPLADGLLKAAAAGAFATPAQDDTVNHTPALAALLAYGEAIGVTGAQCDDGHYSAWQPFRTADDDMAELDQSGIAFVNNRPWSWVSGPNGSAKHRRTWTGADPAIYANTQILPDNRSHNGQGMPWRGGLYFCNGVSVSEPMPAKHLLPSLSFIGKWDIDGGIPESETAKNGPSLFWSEGVGQSGATPGWYELKGDGSGEGWDVTDKPIWACFDTWGGDITFDGDVRIGGFRGELMYQGGPGGGSIYQYGLLTLHNSDGDAFNPGPQQPGGTVQMENVYIHDCYAVWEGWTGVNGKVKIIAERCRSGSIQGGVPNLGLLPGNYYTPTRGDARAPFCDIDITLRNVHRFHPGSWLRGRITTIDHTGGILIGDHYVFGDGPYDTDLVIDVWADRANVGVGAAIVGHSTPGMKSVRNVRLEVNCHQTDYAKVNGFIVNRPLDWHGSLGPDIWVVNGKGTVKQLPAKATTTPDCQINFKGNKWEQQRDALGNIGVSGNIYDADSVQHAGNISETTFSYTSEETIIGGGMRLVILRLPEVYPWTEGSGSARIGVGAEWVLKNHGQGPLFIPGQGFGGGIYPRQGIYIPQSTQVRFVYDGLFWNPLGAPLPLSSEIVPRLPSVGGGAIPAGGISDSFMIPLLGCRAETQVVVSGSSTVDMPITASIVALSRVDQVEVAIRNDGASPLTFTERLWKATGFQGWHYAGDPTTPAAPAFVLFPENGGFTVIWQDGVTGGSAITSCPLHAYTDGAETADPTNEIDADMGPSPLLVTGYSNGTELFIHTAAINTIGITYSSRRSVTPSVPVTQNITTTFPSNSPVYSGGGVGGALVNMGSLVTPPFNAICSHIVQTSGTVGHFDWGDFGGNHPAVSPAGAAADLNGGPYVFTYKIAGNNIGDLTGASYISFQGTLTVNIT